ncbi:hypothetical protein I6I06_23230 [Paraburkholderia ginsengisoli]|uniref:Uncharacterized protein n=2 Tax=Paraburkholderia ginsengisoli TaxID=311231 RepID=A0A7T4N5R3_9BURK|nr:hypothetical protein I6I06_23230 [Paraburkholderia ginsengisoli]
MANDSDMPQSETEGPGSAFDTRGPRPTTASPPAFGRLALCIAAAGALAFGVLGTVAYGVWFNHDQQTYAEAIAGVRQALGMPGSTSVAAAGATNGRLAEPVALHEAAEPAAVPGTATATTTSQNMTTAPALTSAGPANAVTATSAPATAATAPDSPTVAPPGAPTPNMASSTKTSLVSDGEEGSRQAVWSGQVARTRAVANPPQTTLADATSTTSARSLSPSPSPRSSRRATNAADPATQQATSGRTGKDARAAQPERRVASSNANANANAANARHKNSLFARMDLLFRRVNYPQHDSGRQQQDLYSHP